MEFPDSAAGLFYTFISNTERRDYINNPSNPNNGPSGKQEHFQLWESESTGEILTYCCNLGNNNQGLGLTNMMVVVICLLLKYFCYILLIIANVVHIPLAGLAARNMWYPVLQHLGGSRESPPHPQHPPAASLIRNAV